LTTISINLLGFEEKERARRYAKPKVDQSLILAVLFIIIAVALNFLGSVVITSLKTGEETRKTVLQEDIKKLDAKLQELKDLEAKRDALIREQKILEFVTGKTYKWSVFLEEFRGLFPDNVWIANLKINEDFSFSLEGTTLDHKSVALFLTSLQNSPYLTRAVLESSIKQASKNGETMVRFKINCNLNPEVGK